MGLVVEPSTWCLCVCILYCAGGELGRKFYRRGKKKNSAYKFYGILQDLRLHKSKEIGYKVDLSTWKSHK